MKIGKLEPVSTWYATEALTAKWGQKNETVVLEALECNAALEPRGLDHATIVARGLVEVELSQNAPPVVNLRVESLEIAVPSAKVEDGGLAHRWTLDIDRLDGASAQVHLGVDVGVPAGSSGRFVPTLEAQGQLVEVITPDPGPLIITACCPQRLLGTLIGRTPDGLWTLRFPDGTDLSATVHLNPEPTPPASGFFQVISPGPPSLQLKVVAPAAIPDSGQNEMLLARSGDRLHFRIFDDQGHRVFDGDDQAVLDKEKDQDRKEEKRKLIEDLRAQWGGQWTTTGPEKRQRPRIIATVLLILRPIDINAGWKLRTPDIGIANLESLLVVAEVSRVDDQTHEVELTDAYGTKWLLPPETDIGGVKQAECDLPLATVAASLRKVRKLVPGEWLVLACHMDGSPGQNTRALRVGVAAGPEKLATARSMLLGRLNGPPAAPISKAGEGGAEFRPYAYQSLLGREISVWSNTDPTPKGQMLTAWSQRLVLAETLTQYDFPEGPAQAPGANVRRTSLASRRMADNPTPPGEPLHLMVSELITRWPNWGLGLQLPGHPDEQPASPPPGTTSNYKITLSRPLITAISPFNQPPFDRASWQLPALRFDQDYRFCLRRTDLAGNHLYEEAWPPADPKSPLYSGLDTLEEEPQAVDAFRRSNLPVAPILAYKPEHLLPTLSSANAPTSSVPSAVKSMPARNGEPFDASKVAYLFRCLPSEKRKPILVLLTDVLDPGRVHDADAVMELLPPPIDVETMLMHGCLDEISARDAASIIRRHERYLDLPDGSHALGRLAADGQLNYLPDPTAGCLAVAASSPTTTPPNCPAVSSQFFQFDKWTKPGATEKPWTWPNVRWIRLVLKSIARRRYGGPADLPLAVPPPAERADASTFAIYLPPGVSGQAVLSARPRGPQLTSAEYVRMLRDHGGDTRTVSLVHATNGPWTRPRWKDLAEAPRDPAAAPSATRDLAGELEIDRLTTGSWAATSYWNDPWDELVPAQHEPAHAVVEVNAQGNAVACHVLKHGFGFGTQAVPIFESAGLPYRKPTFRPVLRCGQLAALQYDDPGMGCNVLFRVYVTQGQLCCWRYVRTAVALAWHDESGKLMVQIVDPGACLGPYVQVFVKAERPALPELAITLKDGAVQSVALASTGRGRYTADLHVLIVRRPPFYRVAEARVTAFTAGGGIAKVEIVDGGGWYTNPPHCVAHDPAGDGFGAVLAARLDEQGGVISVDVQHAGRLYSRDARIGFYNQVLEVPEAAVDEPTSRSIAPTILLQLRQAFPDPNARRVDVVAQGSSRFRQYLLDDAQADAFGDDVSGVGPLLITRHIRRTSPVRQVEVVSHVRPARPEVVYMMPAFDWEVLGPKNEAEVDPATFFAGRVHGRIVVRRDARIRIYLRRPWHGTGPELLAVIVAPTVLNTTLSTSQQAKDPTAGASTSKPIRLNPNDGGVYNPAALPNVSDVQPGFLREPVEGYAIDDNLRKLVSRWGYDPAWNEAPFPPLTVDHFPERRPVTIYDDLNPADGGSSDQVTFRRPLWIAPHQVHYDSAKDLWYADIQVDVSSGGPPVTALPFVRLSLARYQEHGLPGRRLSSVTLCDMYKLMGRRDVEVERVSAQSFRVALRGEFDQPPKHSEFPRRDVFVRLEARDPQLSTDVVEYVPPPTFKGPEPGTTAMLAEIALVWNPTEKAYAKEIEFPDDAWQSAQFLSGKPSVAVLSIIEYEIFPTSESQADRTGTEVLMLADRLCARRLVYCSTFQLNEGGTKR